ncbi:hypothetical protein [Qipengyuania sphaerica]|nr:hypothetical protein [Qipengyuania sphaerica]
MDGKTMLWLGVAVIAFGGYKLFGVIPGIGLAVAGGIWASRQ